MTEIFSISVVHFFFQNHNELCVVNTISYFFPLYVSIAEVLKKQQHISY